MKVLRRFTVNPRHCLERNPTGKTIRLGGRFISLTTLCEKGDFDQGYLSYILSGERTPSISYASRVAQALGLLTADDTPDVSALLDMIAVRKVELAESGKRRSA